MLTCARSRSALVAVVLVLGSSAAAAGATAGTTGTGRITANTPLGDPSPGLGRDVPGIAVDPANADHVVEVDEDFGRGQCTFRTTFDGGRTWAGGDLTVAAGPASVADPAAPPCNSFDSAGNAHLDQSVAFGSGANVYTTFSSRNAVVVSHSSDGGKSWAPGGLAIAAPPVSGAADIRPQLAVVARPEGDRIHLSALSPSNGMTRLVTTWSDDGGATWNPVVDVQGEGDSVREPAQPAVGPDAAIYIAWHSLAGSTAGHVVVARSVDQGVTWLRAMAAEVPEAGGFPYLTGGRAAGSPQLVFVGGREGGTDISLQQSTDGGSTWSAPVRVSDDRPVPQPVDHLVPRLGSAPNGRLDVVWTDTRDNYPGSLGFGDVWYSSSSDGGKTFSTNRRVNDRTINLGPGAAAQSALARHSPLVTELDDNRILFAWGDSRNAGVGTGVDADSHSGSDVYMATMDLGATGPMPVTALDDTAPEKLSVDLSRLAFPGGTAQAGSQRTTRVVLVNSTDDTGLALPAAVLARANESPLLLADATDLTSDQKAEVSRLAPGGAYLVGAATRLSDKVASSLTKAGATDVQRITGDDSTDTARRIAMLLDSRDDADRSQGKPAFEAAVIVNSQTGDAYTGTALAAALRLPVLFTQRDTIPPATTDALTSLAIKTTLVIGGPASVSNGVVAALPGAKRLGGDNPTSTSEAVATEAMARNVPANVVYVSDGERPIDQAAIGAAVANLGGLMLAEPNAGATAARRSIDVLGITPVVDRLVSVRSNTAGAGSGIRIALGLVILLIGVAAIGVALAHRDREDESGSTTPGGDTDSPNRSRVPGRSG